MSEKIAVDLGNVQKTLILPLWGRAFESGKEKPLLVDKAAVAIIDKIDYDFATITQNISPLTQQAWIIRSIFTDEVIRAFLSKYPEGTIVNIGCGLDTTFDRVDNGTLLWYDLDLPDVIRLRSQFIEATRRRKFISLSFLEEGWLDEINVSQSVLFIAAGVFYYFDESEIKGFLLRLADRFPACEIFFDASSPYGVKVANKMVIRNSGLDEKSYLKWGLENPQVILSWDQRFRLLATRYYFREEGRFLPLNVRLVGLFSDFMKIQYMVHLKL